MELIKRGQAAELLKVDDSSITNFVRKGLLIPHYPDRRQAAQFDKIDVAALLEAREGNYDFKTVVAIALRAQAIARAAAERVDTLERFIGMHLEPLGLDEESVVQVYAKAQEELLKTRIETSSDVVEWARILFTINEEYMDLLTAYCGEEAWQLFYDLQKHLPTAVPTERVMSERDFELAFKYLDVGRKNMLTTLFFHVRTHYGPRRANSIFHDEDCDPSAKILRIIEMITESGLRKKRAG